MKKVGKVGSRARPDNTAHKTSQSTKNFPETQDHDEKLDFLSKVAKKIAEESELSKLLNGIMQMTQKTLKASASSVLLVDEDTGKLSFVTARGKAGSTITQMSLKVQSGIAPWVAHHCQPLIVNDVTKDRRFNKSIDKKTGFQTKSILCAPLVAGGKTIGALELINKLDGGEFNNHDLELLTPLAQYAALTIDNTRLHQLVLEGYVNTIKVLSATIDAKDPYTYGHSQRVTEYALMAAVAHSLPPEELKTIEYAGILHDVGKIAVNEAILRKPASLTREEWEVIRIHPSVGADIVANVPFLGKAKEMVVAHHEKYDGSGYPRGLRGEDIPFGARILAVADAFDTMTTSRSYRAALSIEYALSELRKCTGTQFCPVAVEAFISGFEQHRKKSSNPSFESGRGAT